MFEQAQQYLNDADCVSPGENQGAAKSQTCLPMLTIATDRADGLGCGNRSSRSDDLALETRRGAALVAAHELP
jgi:hypothetical protein